MVPIALYSQLASVNESVHTYGSSNVSADALRSLYWLCWGCSFAILVIVVLAPKRLPVMASGCTVNFLAASTASILVWFLWRNGFSTRAAVVLLVVSLCEFLLLFYCGIRLLRRTFTFAELIVVCHGLTLISWIAGALTIAKLSHYKIGRWAFALQNGDVSATLLAACFWAFVAFLVVSPLAHALHVNKAKRYRTLLCAIVFCCLGTFAIVGLFWASAIQGCNIFLWGLRFVLFDTSRSLLAFYWLAVITITVVIVYFLLDPQWCANDGLRKVFHLSGVLIFAPAIVVDREMLRLATGVALCGMVTMELLRYANVVPSACNYFIICLSNKQDSGVIVLTHIYLLVGLSIPLWLSTLSHTPPHFLAPCAGILIIGVGDAVASVVGKNFGHIHWPGTKKTIEGTSAACISVFAVCGIFALVAGEAPNFGATFVAMAAVMAMLAESFTTQIDNLILPLRFFSLLAALPRYT